MECVDFKVLRKNPELALIFPGWCPGEKVAFLSPHDDDVLLGAGYLLHAVVANGGIPLVFIFSSGDAGYSTIGEKVGIVETRKQEALRAYGMLGVTKEMIHFYDIPDFSLMPFVNRELGKEKGLFEEQVECFRKNEVSRVVFASGNYEHWDHTAVYLMGIYTSPQAGDPILADLGKPQAAATYLVYSVWGDFVEGRNSETGVRADKGMLVDEETEASVREAIQAFASQRRIFQHIVAFRERRKSDAGYLELYQEIKVRQQTDFGPYFELMKQCKP